MITPTLEYLAAIEHLPAGAVLHLTGVGWDEYEELLQATDARPNLRVSYDAGRVELMSSLAEHEAYKDTFLILVSALADELDLELESRGSTTYKQKKKVKGVEPDTCFYVANARRVIGLKRIDLNVDPPPDVVVEIDVTNLSTPKFPIYSAFGVPEMWLYDGAELEFYELMGDGKYRRVLASPAFPILIAEEFAKFIALSLTDGQTAALKVFRRFVRERNVA